MSLNHQFTIIHLWRRASPTIEVILFDISISLFLYRERDTENCSQSVSTNMEMTNIRLIKTQTYRMTVTSTERREVVKASRISSDTRHLSKYVITITMSSLVARKESFSRVERTLSACEWLHTKGTKLKKKKNTYLL